MSLSRKSRKEGRREKSLSRAEMAAVELNSCATGVRLTRQARLYFYVSLYNTSVIKSPAREESANHRAIAVCKRGLTIIIIIIIISFLIYVSDHLVYTICILLKKIYIFFLRREETKRLSLDQIFRLCQYNMPCVSHVMYNI